MAFRYSLQSPQHTVSGSNLPVWSHPAFMTAVARVHGLKTWHLCCFKGDILAALLPVYERNRLGIRQLVCPPLAYYQPLSIFVEPGTLQPRQNSDHLQIASGIAEFLAKTFRRVTFNLGPESLDVRAFTWAGFKARPLYTYIWDTACPPEPGRNEQRKLKAAAAQGYAYHEEFDPEAFRALLAQLYQRKKHQRSFSDTALLVFLKELQPTGLLHQCNLHLDGRIVSSNIVFGTGSGTAYAVIGASSENALKTGASSMQTVEMLAAFKDRYNRVDLCGANVPQVARFKAALGLQLRLFFRIEGSSGLL